MAAVVSTGMAQREEVTLLVDIGTNGEIVLGNRDFLYSCSTAAGPALKALISSVGQAVLRALSARFCYR